MITASYHGHSSNAATVYFTPPWWAFWRRTTERVALLTRLPLGGLRWRWLDGSDVPGAVWLVLTDAYREATSVGGAA